jgi:hypothetical protein
MQKTSYAEKSVVEKLEYFRINNKIPHILFYGPTHSNKDLLVSEYIQRIYESNKVLIKQNVLFVSCSGKGIKFIRDEIKTFSKMHIHANVQFKTVVLLHADFLTDDAQSALRRSIELFSYNTRFFLLVENRSKLLKPILSRFCEIYVPPNETPTQLTNHTIIHKDMTDLENPTEGIIMNMAAAWVEKGLSSYDFLYWVQYHSGPKRLMTEFLFHCLKREYRCEKLFLWTLLDFYLFRSYEDLCRICSVK